MGQLIGVCEAVAYLSNALFQTPRGAFNVITIVQTQWILLISNTRRNSQEKTACTKSIIRLFKINQTHTSNFDKKKNPLDSHLTNFQYQPSWLGITYIYPLPSSHEKLCITDALYKNLYWTPDALVRTSTASPYEWVMEIRFKI